MHIHFAYYKLLRTNSVGGMKEDGLMQMLLFEYLDSHRDSALESVRSIPSCDMDQIKRHILIHPSCPVSAIVDKKTRGPWLLWSTKNGIARIKMHLLIWKILGC